MQIKCKRKRPRQRGKKKKKAKTNDLDLSFILKGLGSTRVLLLEVYLGIKLFQTELIYKTVQKKSEKQVATKHEDF